MGKPTTPVLIPITSSSCTATHHACDCVLDRLNKLEALHKAVVAYLVPLDREVNDTADMLRDDAEAWDALERVRELLKGLDGT
jgi:hypothetical protein